MYNVWKKWIFSYFSDDFFLLCLSDLGDPACGFCVFRCCFLTKVQCSHRVGVSDYFTSAAAVCAQTQQEADFLLLASHCGWSLTTLHNNIPHMLRRIAVHIALLLFSRLQDVFNSVFAAAFFIVLSLMAVTSYTVTGSLVGGVRDISLIYNCNQSCVAQFWFEDFGFLHTLPIKFNIHAMFLICVHVL